MAADPSGQGVTLFAGCDAVDCQSFETWNWTGTDWAPGTPTQSPTPRTGVSAAYDSVRQEIVLFGGEDPDPATIEPVMGDTWAWDGSDWALRSPAVDPAGRFDPALVYDEARHQVVLYGGVGEGAFGDTWTWDGSGWTRQRPASSPPPGIGVTATYDSVRQQVVVFGGSTGETWVWDGFEWAQPGQGPSRSGAGMAFDDAMGATVLFGGQTMEQYGCGADDAAEYPYPCAETWNWDGIGWTQLSPSDHPSRRYNFSMAYDPIRNQVVLFGGFGPNDPILDIPTRLGDTWTWNGSDWTKQHPADSPPPGAGRTMAFDPATGNVVLLANGNTWSWTGSTWVNISVPGSPPIKSGGGARLAFDSNANGLLFGAFDPDPGPDGSSWHYGLKPVASTTVDTSGGTLSTPAPFDSTHPLSTTINVGSTSAGGKVSIAQTGPTHGAPKAFGFIGAQAWIVMPPASAGSSHTLDFQLDPSLIAGDPGATLYVFRTGSSKPKRVNACNSTPPPDPDPCVSDQHIAPEGVVHISVSTTSGPIWNFALPLFARSVGITYKHARHRFTGKISSSKHACIAGQKVTAFRKRAGPDRKVGSDITSSTGVYRVHYATSKGSYYAQVPRQMRSGVGFCGPAKSSAIRV